MLHRWRSFTLRIAFAMAFASVMAGGRLAVPDRPAPAPPAPVVVRAVAPAPSLPAATPPRRSVKRRMIAAPPVVAEPVVPPAPATPATIEAVLEGGPSEPPVALAPPQRLSVVSALTGRPLQPVFLSSPVARPGPRRALVPLYVSFGALQAMDYHSTRRALVSGAGREANPLARAIGSPGLIAAKAAATAVVIVAGEKIWKRNRVGAVVFVATLNVAMGAVVAHNYSVGRKPLRAR